MFRPTTAVVTIAILVGLTGISATAGAQPAPNLRPSGSVLTTPSTGNSSLGAAPGTNVGPATPRALGAAPGTSLGTSVPSSQALGAAPGTTLGNGRP